MCAGVLDRDVADVFAHTLIIFRIDHSCCGKHFLHCASVRRGCCVFFFVPKTLNRSFGLAGGPVHAAAAAAGSLAQIMHMMSIWECRVCVASAAQHPIPISQRGRVR